MLQGRVSARREITGFVFDDAVTIPRSGEALAARAQSQNLRARVIDSPAVVFVPEPEDAAVTPTIRVHITSPTPGTETSFALPPTVKRFLVNNPNGSALTVSFAPDQAGTGEWVTVPSWSNYDEGPIKDSSITLYFRSSLASQRVEITYWT